MGDEKAFQEISENLRKRELGMMLGLHAGDSLGATLEFGPPSKPGKCLEDIVGGGHFEWGPGDATDDTDLAICVLEKVIQFFHEKWDDSNVQTRFICELEESFLRWFDSNPKDIGRTMREALLNLRDGMYPSGVKHERSQSNGSLMRCAAMALVPLPPEKLDELVGRVCAITHAHPNCIAADKIFVRSLVMALEGRSKYSIYREAVIKSLKLSPALNKYIEEVPYLTWDKVTNKGFVGDTLASGYYALLNCEHFTHGVGDVANRGDDADTCAAVAGALCGAYYTVYSIPPKWLKVLKRREEIERLIDKRWD